MNKHHTKFKGDIGLAMAIAELTELNYIVAIPISEHQHYDIIVDFDGELKKVQVKYSTNGIIKGTTSYVNSDGKSTYRKYELHDFDLYVLYIPKLKKCLFIPNTKKTASIRIRYEHPKTNNTNYYWWEDFLNPLSTTLPNKRKLLDFGISPKIITRKGEFCKVQDKPTKNELMELINSTSFVQIGKKYGVSDNAVRKWAKKYELI